MTQHLGAWEMSIWAGVRSPQCRLQEGQQLPRVVWGCFLGLTLHTLTKEKSPGPVSSFLEAVISHQG